MSLTPSRQLVVKIASRCNIACSYCYMYYRGDDSALRAPKKMSLGLAKSLGARIINYIDHFSLEHVVISFHGGEPLLVGKKHFVDILDTLIAECGSDKLGFIVQTNGMLFDDEWAAIFVKYNVNVGFSLDGPAVSNDVSRMDHQGNSTYDRVVCGLKIAQAWEDRGLKLRGVISVVEPNINAIEYYRHMTDVLGINTINILLPDADHDTYAKYVNYPPVVYGEYLCDLFDAWWRDFPLIRIRFFEDIIRSVLGHEVTTDLLGTGECASIIIGTNGDIEVHDVARINDVELATNINIVKSDIHEIYDIDSYSRLNTDYKIPSECSKCSVFKFCRSGFKPHRFSKSKGYDNQSVYCDALKKIINHIYFVLISEGAVAKKQDAYI